MILGVNSFTHDSAIALIDKNKPILLMEEERISRKKHHDGFIFDGSPPNNVINLVKKKYRYDKIAHSKDIDYSAMRSNILQMKFLNFAKSLDPNLKKTNFFNHHLCHAASAFFCSNYDTAYIVTLDSRGDGLSLTISFGQRNHIRKIFELPARTSICAIYSYVSELLGLGKRKEGSLMSLAAYGEENLTQSLFCWNGKSIIINSNEIIQLAKKARKFSELSNIAYSVQKSFEETVLSIINDICIDRKIKNICLGGGGFLNCRLNMAINDTKRWDNIYIPPCAGDSGTALGAAILSLNEPSNFKLSNSFLGTRYSQQVIGKKLLTYKIKHTETYPKQIASLIANGKVIAIFYGAMEFGQRALGHRSIIADPRKKSSKTKLNSIKKRKQWRPIAPAVLHDYGLEWFENYSFSPFMTRTFKIKEDKAKIVPAILHIDNSSRLQSVKSDDGFFYELLCAFNSLTGIPLLCNTSFNISSPIVQSAEDALATFFNSAIDYLYIEGWLISK